MRAVFSLTGVGMQDMCVRPVVYSHEDLVPEVAIGGDGGVHAEAGVVAGGVDEG
jgi:hypothetical protein